MFSITRIAAAVVAAVALLSVAPAAEADRDTYREACASAWQHPQSRLAEKCRAEGWTVNRRLVVSPYNVLKHSTLPQCRIRKPGPLPCTLNVEDPVVDRGAAWVGRGHVVHPVRLVDFPRTRPVR